MYYRFYKDELHYTEHSLQDIERTIYLKDVMGIDLKKGILQQSQGLGTITLHLRSANSETNVGVSLQDLQNPNEAFTRIRNLVKQSKSSHSS